MRVALTILVALGATASLAEAHGYCDEQNAREMVVGTEAFARGKAKEMPADWGDCVTDSIAPNPKLEARLLAACTKIVDADPENTSCIAWGVQAGAKQLGSLDLFTAVTTHFDLKPFEQIVGMQLLEQLDDARAPAVLRALWADAAADPRSRSKKSDFEYRWALWRHTALHMFERQGTADDSAFLTEQLPATKDRGVIRAMHRAISAIDKRAHASPTTAGLHAH